VRAPLPGNLISDALLREKIGSELVGRRGPPAPGALSCALPGHPVGPESADPAAPAGARNPGVLVSGVRAFRASKLSTADVLSARAIARQGSARKLRSQSPRRRSCANVSTPARGDLRDEAHRQRPPLLRRAWRPASREESTRRPRRLRARAGAPKHALTCADRAPKTVVGPVFADPAAQAAPARRRGRDCPSAFFPSPRSAVRPVGGDGPCESLWIVFFTKKKKKYVFGRLPGGVPWVWRRSPPRPTLGLLAWGPAGSLARGRACLSCTGRGVHNPTSPTSSSCSCDVGELLCNWT